MTAPPPPDWARVRTLFFAAHAAGAAERARLLADPAMDPAVRAYVARMLDADAAAGARLETPALVALHGSAPGAGPHGDDAWAAAPSLVGRQLGPYRVVRRVGQGGMGAVYEAERIDGAYAGRVAVKTLWRGADSAVLARRFRSERQILAGLQHPNIARLLDGGATAEGTPYLVMEYVDGVPIDAYCDERRLGLAARLDLFLQVCAAVAHAHRHLVVHRDLKPANVLVTADGTVKLLDFGVAKLLGEAGAADAAAADTSDPGAGAGPGTLTGAGFAPFTAAYAAPEQLAGARASTATDVYALGALLTVLVAGRPPFDVDGLGAAEAVWVRAQAGPAAPSALALAGAAPRALGTAGAAGSTAAAARGFATAAQHARALRGELDAICGMALRDDPARRYATADALADDARRYLRRDRVTARPDTVGYRVRTFARRQRALAAGAGVAALALVAGSAVALWQARASRREAERSEQVAVFLTRLFAGQDASTGDPVARLGPRGSVAQLLDSAARRIPAAFPADARVRARLYTAVGANDAAQGRLREAAAVLDSAARLARASYGPRSDAFASASLELGDALLSRAGPAVAGAHVRAALGALAGRERDAPELYARALVLLARVREAAGEVRAADALARRADALERARTRSPTITRAWAARVLGHTTAWLRRDPRLAGALHAHAVAIADSLGTPLARERIEALGQLSETELVLGRVAAAGAHAAAAVDAARRGYGEASVEYAGALARAAAVAGERTPGDAAAATAASALAAAAWRVIDALPDAPAETVMDVAMPLVDDHLAHGRAAAALLVAQRAAARVAPQRVPVATVFAQLYLGRARLAAGDAAGAERALRAGMAALPPTRDLDSMLPRFRRPLAEAMRASGAGAAADSVARLDRPRAAVPRCTPGGDWRGC